MVSQLAVPKDAPLDLLADLHGPESTVSIREPEEVETAHQGPSPPPAEDGT